MVGQSWDCGDRLTMAKWQSTRFPGVRVRESGNKRFQGKPDKYFAIRYKRNGKSTEEGLGWLSAGISAAYASQVRVHIMQNFRSGEGFQSLREKRELEENRQKEEAEKKISKALQNTTFKVFAKKYIEWAQSAKKTWKVDDGALRIHILPEIGNLPAKDIGVLTLERLKRTLLKKELSQTTVKYYMIVLGSVFNKAKAWGIFDGENPVKVTSTSNRKFMKIPDNRRLRFLSHEEADLLLKEIKTTSPQLHDICLLSLHAGLRAGECFDLTWYDVDLKHKVINIRNPKNDESRQAYLTPQLENMFQARTTVNQKRSELVFKNCRGGRLREVGGPFGRTADSLGFNDGVENAQNRLVFHSLRHTFASWLALQGSPILTIKELLGHKDIKMTMRYSHLMPDQKREAVLQLAENQSQAVVALEQKRKKK